MKHRLRVILFSLVALLVVFVILVGPWPVRRSEPATYSRPLNRALRTLADAWASDAVSGEDSVAFSRDGQVRAGWAIAPLELPPGTPLAGYGDRRGAPNEGTLDPLELGAVVFSSNGARAALVASDLLIVPANIAEQVRVAAGMPVLFTATHTHGGPGAATRGLVARAFGGRYSAEVERAIVRSLVDVITEAGETHSTVSFSVESFNREQFIRNRTRESTAGYPLTDPYLDVIMLETPSQGRLTLIRYSAHATIIPADEMRFSAGYPGAVRNAFEERYGGQALFMAGAVGSMSPSLPADLSGPRHEAYGRALIGSLPEALEGGFEPVPAFGVVDLRVQGPPVQLRLTRGLRLSPLFLASQTVDRQVRLTVLRLGPLVLIGFPADISGEIGAVIRMRYAAAGIGVIPLSFSGDYLGYVSPDAYYAELHEVDGLAYETGIMSWAGPAQERFFVDISRAVIASL